MERRSYEDLPAGMRTTNRTHWTNSPQITPTTEKFPAIPRVNPFDTPSSSRLNSGPPSTFASSNDLPRAAGRDYFRSRRIRKGAVEKPWLKNKDPREKWVTIIPVLGILVGLAVSGFLVYDGLHSVVNHTYCTVLDEDFSLGLNPHVWTKEAEVGGFG
jgi:hypothetical protein